MSRVPVTERALFQRVQRALRVNGHQLVHPQHSGVYYVVDGKQIVTQFTPLDGYARKLGVMAPYEELVS